MLFSLVVGTKAFYLFLFLHIDLIFELSQFEGEGGIPFLNLTY
jgi:hypothetical protein